MKVSRSGTPTMTIRNVFPWRRLFIATALLAAAGLIGLWLAYRHFDRTPNEIIRYLKHRLDGHPKLEFIALPLLKAWQATTLRPVPGIDFPTLGKGARKLPPAIGGGTIIAVSSAEELIAAMSKAIAGNVIELQPGRYHVAHWLNTAHPGTPEAPIVVRARQLGDAIVELDILDGFHVQHPHWIFENLEIVGVCQSDDACEHAFHVVGNARNTIVRNNLVRDFNAHVKVNGHGMAWPDHGLIEHNTFLNNRPRNTDKPVAVLNINTASYWQVLDNVIENFAKPGGRDPTAYGVFMKGASSHGRIERNLIICTTRGDIHQPGIRVGLSFGGGGTDRIYCRDNECKVEHREGIAANNLIAHCNDFGIDINRSTGILVTHNTLINTEGIDVRDFPATATIRGNVLEGRIRARKGGWLAEDNNRLTNLTREFVSADTLDITWTTRPYGMPSTPAAANDFSGRQRHHGTRPGSRPGNAS